MVYLLSIHTHKEGEYYAKKNKKKKQMLFALVLMTGNTSKDWHLWLLNIALLQLNLVKIHLFSVFSLHSHKY